MLIWYLSQVHGETQTVLSMMRHFRVFPVSVRTIRTPLAIHRNFVTEIKQLQAIKISQLSATNSNTLSDTRSRVRGGDTSVPLNATYKWARSLAN